MRITGLLLAALALVACSQEGTPCYPGDYAICSCPSGVRGYMRCSSDGSGYGSCDCRGVSPVSPPAAAAPAASASDGGASLLGLMDPCERDDQCATGLCFTFNAKGPKCSKPCEVDG